MTELWPIGNIVTLPLELSEVPLPNGCEVLRLGLGRQNESSSIMLLLPLRAAFREGGWRR
jgi:hypothetical protein